eukprot:jgi/Ulvmu1/12726/UM095_0030.1
MARILQPAVRCSPSHGRNYAARLMRGARRASYMWCLNWHPTEIAVAPDRCLSVKAQQSTPHDTYLELRKDWRRPLCSPLTGKGHSVCVALGKFDAMHKGHRCLVEEATQLGGYPCLLSFWGMAEVLGLAPRKPLTAAVDRSRVLSLWASHCSGVTPMQRNIPFASIRQMSAPEFVDLLWYELQIKGVVVGINYRFGYKASGDAALLKQLGEERGMLVSVVDLRDAAYANESEVCSSSRVRESLQTGDVQRVQSHLDRPYAIVVACEALHPDIAKNGVWKFPGAKALTQLPAEASYHVNVCSGSAKNCFTQVVLHVAETGCWAEMDGAELCGAGGHIRFDIIDRVE